MNLRDFIRAIAPPFLLEDGWEEYIYNLGLAADALLEKVAQGVSARVPTYGDESALPLIGDDRSIPSGLNEPGSSYALRLKRALTDWQRAGSARARMGQVLGYLFTPRARIRTVTNSSRWETYEEGADITKAPAVSRGLANWSWDDATVLPWPPVPLIRQWIRIWTVLYANPTQITDFVSIVSASNSSPIVIATNKEHELVTGNAVAIGGVLGNTNANGLHAVNVLTPTTFELKYSSGNGAPFIVAAAMRRAIMAPAPKWGAFGLVWGAKDVSWGLAVPSSEGDALRRISDQWKGAHAWLLWIIVTFDNSLFNPSAALGDASLPDGTWGHWGKTVGGVRVKARSANARYVRGIA